MVEADREGTIKDGFRRCEWYETLGKKTSKLKKVFSFLFCNIIGNQTCIGINDIIRFKLSINQAFSLFFLIIETEPLHRTARKIVFST